MSFLVTRPPRPVPDTCATSTACSEAIRATTGETNVLSPAPSVAGSTGSDATGCSSTTGSGGGGSCATGSGSGSSAGSGSCGATSAAGGVTASGSGSAGGAASASPAGAITASLVPTSTVSPSWTRICWTTPSPGLGTSVSTLSVEISSSGSSAAICSPSCLSHLVIVPSETETPICGMTTSMADVVATLRVLG